jgi:hypothetical protein
MTISVLHYYCMKAEFLPPELPSLGIYVRPGELAKHVNPDHWDIVGAIRAGLSSAPNERGSSVQRSIRLDGANWPTNGWLSAACPSRRTPSGVVNRRACCAENRSHHRCTNNKKTAPVGLGAADSRGAGKSVAAIARQTHRLVSRIGQRLLLTR